MSDDERSLQQYARDAISAGVPQDQLLNFIRAGLRLELKQLQFAAACRLADKPGGPTSIAALGARGGGKSLGAFAQLSVDDCQRFPGLKCLYLRKVGKANKEHMEDLRNSVLRFLPHDYTKNGIIIFPNDSKIICGHYQNENDIAAYVGLEYDVILTEEISTISTNKYQNILTCCRSAKAGWRPRDYVTGNPGGFSHKAIKDKFVTPLRQGKETNTRCILSYPGDNPHLDPDYVRTKLASLTGVQRAIWLEGSWDIMAGQYFTNWNEAIHVLSHWDDRKAAQWFLALDYGFQHYTTVGLFAVDGAGIIYLVDMHAARKMQPFEHAKRLKAMLSRHGITSFGQLRYAVAGADVFAAESDGTSISNSYRDLGITLTCANTDRIAGAAELSRRLGDAEHSIAPIFFVHKNCTLAIEQIPAMVHDESRNEDVLKVDCNDDGQGGDDAYDMVRYGLASFRRIGVTTKIMSAATGKYNVESIAF